MRHAKGTAAGTAKGAHNGIKLLLVLIHLSVNQSLSFVDVGNRILEILAVRALIKVANTIRRLSQIQLLGIDS